MDDCEDAFRTQLRQPRSGDVTLRGATARVSRHFRVVESSTRTGFEPVKHAPLPLFLVMGVVAHERRADAEALEENPLRQSCAGRISALSPSSRASVRRIRVQRRRAGREGNGASEELHWISPYAACPPREWHPRSAALSKRGGSCLRGCQSECSPVGIERSRHTRS